MTLTYRGTAYHINSTDAPTSADSINCQYRGVPYRMQPAGATRSCSQCLQYQGTRYGAADLGYELSNSPGINSVCS